MDSIISEETEIVNVGGYDLKTLNEDKRFECTICHHLIKDAVKVPCSHLFCRSCIGRYIVKDKTTKGTFVCPECGKPVPASKIRPNAFVDSLIKGCNVYCSQKDKGCEWTGTVALFLKKHKDSCLYQIVPCNYEGCKHSGMKRKIEDHEAECKFKVIECQHCQAPINPNKVDEHHTICEGIPAQCPQNGCDAIITKKEMQEHLEKDCKFALISCTYSKFGCPDKVLREDLEQHVHDSKIRHMAFMCPHFKESRSMLQDLTDQVKASNTKMDKLRIDVDHLNNLNRDVPLLIPPYVSCFEYKVIKLMSKGGEKWLKKNDEIYVDCFGGYSSWYQRLGMMMKENELYQYNNVMFVKVKDEIKNGIIWSSNTTKQQDKVLKATSNVVHKGRNRVMLRNVDDCLVLDTESSKYFNSKNSKAYALHEYHENEIVEFAEKVRGDVNICSTWYCPKLSDRFYFLGHVILCVVRT